MQLMRSHATQLDINRNNNHHSQSTALLCQQLDCAESEQALVNSLGSDATHVPLDPQALHPIVCHCCMHLYDHNMAAAAAATCMQLPLQIV